MTFIVYCAICRKSFYTDKYRESYWCPSCVRKEQERFADAKREREKARRAAKK
jgi:uncharacterized CHY-type Zn-finger protein